MYASDPIGGWAQTISRSLEETKPDNEGSGKKRGVEMVGCRSDLANTSCPKKRRDHSDMD